nr:MAG TPA: hypothetical protein [Caudoviricetes sp.]
MTREVATFPCKYSIFIKYMNANGELSSRLVDINRFTYSSEGNFVGFCHKRKMSRTFSFVNVLEVTDAITGEILNPAELHNYLYDIYQQSPESELDEFISEYQKVIEILEYISICDGSVVISERRAIVTWILETAHLSDDLQEYAMKIVKNWKTPEKSDFIRAILWVARFQPEMRDVLLQQAEIVAHADKKLHSEEIYALNYLKRIFNLSK